MFGEWDEALAIGGRARPRTGAQRGGLRPRHRAHPGGRAARLPRGGAASRRRSSTGSSGAVSRARSAWISPTRCSSAAPYASAWATPRRRCGLLNGWERDRGRAAAPTTSPTCPRRCGRRSRPATTSSPPASRRVDSILPMQRNVRASLQGCSASGAASTRRRRPVRRTPPPAGATSACPTRRRTRCSAAAAACWRSGGRREAAESLAVARAIFARLGAQPGAGRDGRAARRLSASASARRVRARARP